MFGSIQEMIVNIPVVLFAITVHEYAHARTALFLGDPTAKMAGRITFNPVSHLDPIGAICLYLFHFG
jgi:Zn-dependent protease